MSYMWVIGESFWTEIGLLTERDYGRVIWRCQIEIIEYKMLQMHQQYVEKE